jgi:hypothetical protein
VIRRPSLARLRSGSKADGEPGSYRAGFFFGTLSFGANVGLGFVSTIITGLRPREPPRQLFAAVFTFSAGLPTPLVLAPAKILHQAEVFDELKAEPLGLPEILLVLQRVEEVAYRPKVIADQFVEPVALLVVDRGGGHRRPSSR